MVVWYRNTLKPVYNDDHPWDPKIVAVVNRLSLFRGHISNKNSKWDPSMVVVNSGLTVAANKPFTITNT